MLSQLVDMSARRLYTGLRGTYSGDLASVWKLILRFWLMATMRSPLVMPVRVSRIARIVAPLVAWAVGVLDVIGDLRVPVVRYGQ